MTAFALPPILARRSRELAGSERRSPRDDLIRKALEDLASQTSSGSKCEPATASDASALAMTFVSNPSYRAYVDFLH